MRNAPEIDSSTLYWMDLQAAARYASVPEATLLSAASRGDLAAVVTHPRRPGEWMVPVHDVNRWWRHEVALVV